MDDKKPEEAAPKSAELPAKVRNSMLEDDDSDDDDAKQDADDDKPKLSKKKMKKLNRLSVAELKQVMFMCTDILSTNTRFFKCMHFYLCTCMYMCFENADYIIPRCLLFCS